MNNFDASIVARAVVGLDPRYSHTFGGPRRHNGTTPRGCAQPLHLLYTFDTTDPSFPVRIPGVRYLPLYYSFPYNAGACGYRVLSDNEIEVLYMETETIEPNFPFEDYPSEFPLAAIQLLPISYEDHKKLVFAIYAGKDSLSEADRRLVYDEFNYPFTQLGGHHDLCQGVPSVACPNPACEYHEFDCFMEVFGVVWNVPVDGVHLWSTDDWDDIQTIFQICPKCSSIHACNRCT